MTDQSPIATRVWSGIEAEHPPAFRRDYPELLAMAQLMLDSRKRRFPAMISAGKLDGTVAEREIAIFAEILADWQWIVTGQGEPASQASLADRIKALDASLATIADIAREQGGFSADLEHQTNCVIAMRWHLQPRRALGIHDCVRLTRELRTRQKENHNAH